jgi:EAL domain-containing protein (putative c-di-GMP-specific phosphodiesterase class I)
LVARKIAVVSPEFPYSAQIRTRISPQASLYWFAEIEALFAYLFNEQVDEILFDEEIIKNNRSCAAKYQKLITQMHPKLIISTTSILSQSALNQREGLNYFPVLEDLFKNGELQSVFQPIVRPKSTQNFVLGFECLSRIHFNNKIITPEFLFNYAQEKLLLTNYDKVCLMQALRLAPRSPDILIFVNVRPQTLISYDFLPWFKALLKKNNLSAESIIIEVTEQHCVISEPEIALQCHQLRQFGIRIAVDDFGCGISNHSMIEVMKPDFIKISGRFLKNYDTNITKKKIIKNILDLSLDCDISAIVESVESKEDWDLVASLGANLAQGFHFYKPMPHDEMKALLKR